MFSHFRHEWLTKKRTCCSGRFALRFRCARSEPAVPVLLSTIGVLPFDLRLSQPVMQRTRFDRHLLLAPSDQDLMARSHLMRYLAKLQRHNFVRTWVSIEPNNADARAICGKDNVAQLQVLDAHELLPSTLEINAPSTKHIPSSPLPGVESTSVAGECVTPRFFR